MKCTFIACVLSLISFCQSGNVKDSTFSYRACELISINRYLYRYQHCNDSTDYTSLNRLLVLTLDGSMEFDKYRRFRNIERRLLPITYTVALTALADFFVTRIAGEICPESFNPNCNEKDRITTFLPWQAYAVSMGITIPLQIMFAKKCVNT